MLDTIISYQMCHVCRHDNVIYIAVLFYSMASTVLLPHMSNVHVAMCYPMQVTGVGDINFRLFQWTEYQ